MRLHSDVLAKGKLGCGLLRRAAKCLTLLGAVDSVQTDAFADSLMEHSDRVPVCDADHFTILRGKNHSREGKKGDEEEKGYYMARFHEGSPGEA